ncbi:hypothetical protein EYC80_001102 [Monilinia laxa]|uniref:Uncharacterized protein n=1 Tax=Monilinia laxa TaxID=61186 RepID=A0A5N6K826_MONLA|nr:hypothetical protein EYC80_001102 [Monilinia laxa]
MLVEDRDEVQKSKFLSSISIVDHIVSFRLIWCHMHTTLSHTKHHNQSRDPIPNDKTITLASFKRSFIRSKS